MKGVGDLASRIVQVSVIEAVTYLALVLLVAALAQRVAEGIVVQAFARHAL